MTAEARPWLQVYLDEAVARDFCVDIRCTTCGAGEFRAGLRKALAASVAPAADQHGGLAAAQAIAAGLAEVLAPSESAWRYAAAARYILYRIWREHGTLTAESQVWPLLGSSWAAGILQSMKSHHAAVQHEKAMSLKREAERRAEKARLKESRLEERAKRKPVRDDAWRARR